MIVKLTDAQVVVLRKQVAAGKSQTAVARVFGVTQGYVSNVVTGRVRRDAGGPIVKPRRRPSKESYITITPGRSGGSRLERFLDDMALNHAVVAART